MLNAPQALQRLREGNQRFVDNACTHPLPTRPAEVADGQAPIAIVLGCSDSRVPAEIIFDQGLGDLFVIRVAGNVAQPSQIGSVEFAAAKFGTRLVVVLGHSRCGAIQETLNVLHDADGVESGNLRSIVDLIRPSIQTVIEEAAGDNDVVERAVRANVRASAERLRHGSDIIENLERNDGLVIVGAEYSLETGRVDFFDGVPD